MRCSIVVAILLLCCGSSHAHKTDKHSAIITGTTTTVYNSNKALSLGQNRLIIKAIGDNNLSYGGPDIDTRLTLTKGAKTLIYQTYWVWTSKDYSGFYAANVSFSESGEWQAVLSDTTGSALATAFWVNTKSVVPAIGEAAIPSDSKTLSAKAKLKDLTTDDNPDPNFYRQSISDAVKSGKPSVIAFATPDLCRTAVCGPVMRELKGLARELTDVNFIHVEIYEPIKAEVHDALLQIDQR